MSSPSPLGCNRSAYTRKGFTCYVSVGQALITRHQSDWVFFPLSMHHWMLLLYFFCPTEHKSLSMMLGRGEFGSEASSSAMQAITNGRPFCFAGFCTFEGTRGCAACSLKSFSFFLQDFHVKSTWIRFVAILCNWYSHCEAFGENPFADVSCFW